LAKQNNKDAYIKISFAKAKLQPVDKPIDRLADQEKGRDILSK